MSDVGCRAARELAARAELGDLGPAEQMKLELHVQACAECARGAQRVRGVAELLRDEPLEDGGVSDLALVNRALLHAGAPDLMPARPRRAPRWPLLAAAALGLAFLGGGAWLWSRPEPAPRAEAPQPAAPEAPEEPAAPVEPIADSLAHPCPGVTARGVDVTVARSEARRCALELGEGRIALHVDPAQRTRVTIDTPHTTVRVLGTVLSVDVNEARTRVVVERGHVRVGEGDRRVDVRAAQRADATTETITASTAAPASSIAPLSALAAELELGPADEPVEPAADVEAPEPATDASPGRRVARLRRLLREESPGAVRSRVTREMRDPRLSRRRGELQTIVAETYLAEGQYDSAVDAYAQVWRGPRSSTAGNALIAGADVALRRLGDARRARGLYERYLAEYPAGPLREVAAAGRCRALAAGGDSTGARRCVAAYDQAYPDGRFAAGLGRHR